MGIDYHGRDVQYEVDPSILKNDSNLDLELVDISAEARDSNNSTTTTLRAGLVLAHPDGSPDTYEEYDSGAADGTENGQRMVILAEEVDVTNSEELTNVPVVHRGNVNPDKIIVESGETASSLMQPPRLTFS